MPAAHNLIFGYPTHLAIDWDGDGTFEDDAPWSVINLNFGGNRRSNPQRPTIAAGRGSIVIAGLEYVPGQSSRFTEADLRTRHRFRMWQEIGANEVDLFHGWLQAGSGPNGDRMQFTLEGLLERRGREEVGAAQSAALARSLDPSVLSLVSDAYGLAALDSVQMQSTPLGIYGFSGPAARYASQFGQVAGAFPMARAEGGLGLYSPTFPPPVIPSFSSVDYTILNLSTEFDVEQIWNSALVPFIDRGGVIPQSISGYQLFNRTAAMMRDFSIVLPAVPPNSTYENFAISYAGKSSRIRYNISGGPQIYTGHSSSPQNNVIGEFSGGYDAATNTFEARVTGSGWSSSHPDRWFLAETGGGGFIYITYWSTGSNSAGVTSIRLNYLLTYDVVTTDIEQNIDVTAAESVALWDPRVLVFPPWFASTARAAVQQRLDALAEPRSYHTVDFAMVQPDKQRTLDVAMIQPGDYIRLIDRDIVEAIDVDDRCLVVNVSYRLARDRIPIKQLVVLDTGISAAGATFPLTINSIPLEINSDSLRIGF